MRFFGTSLTLLLGLGLAFGASAQTRRLLAGGSQSLFGAVDVGTDAGRIEVELRSGGNLDVRSMALGPGCVGFAMARPDVIVRSTESLARLDFFARANRGDTTLIIHTPDGRWLCDDDSGGGNNPRLEIESPATGQYDVWVGSYRADQNLHTRLRITSVR